MGSGIKRAGRALGMLVTFLPRTVGGVRALVAFLILVAGAELAAWAIRLPDHWITYAAAGLVVMLVSLFANSIELLKKLDDAVGPTVRLGAPKATFSPMLNFSGPLGRGHRAENVLQVRVPLAIWNGESHEIKVAFPHLSILERRWFRRREIDSHRETSGWSLGGGALRQRVTIAARDRLDASAGVTVSGVGDLNSLQKRRLFVQVAVDMGFETRRLTKRLCPREE